MRWKLKSCFLAVLGISLVPAMHHARAGTPSISARDVAEICQQATSGTAAASVANTARAVCMSYLDAVVATVNQISVLVSPDGKNRPPFVFCVPSETDDRELAQVFQAFLVRNPEHGSVAAASLATAAYADRWPCPR